MQNITNLLPSILILIALWVPAAIWLVRWLKKNQQGLHQGENREKFFFSSKCKSCGSQSECGSWKYRTPQQETTRQSTIANSTTVCPATTEILSQFPQQGVSVKGAESKSSSL